MKNDNLNVKAITYVKHWLTNSVIQHQFCPYAKLPYEQGSVGYELYAGDNIIALLESLARCCINLDKTPASELETVLLIVSDEHNFLADFYDYLDVLDATNKLLEAPRKFMLRFSDEFQNNHSENVPVSWRDDYQLASFHPDYVFDGAGQDDRENYTNRSPYPIFHILRNASLDKVRMDDEKAGRIVERNMQCLQGMSNADFQVLQQLRDITDSV